MGVAVIGGAPTPGLSVCEEAAEWQSTQIQSQLPSHVRDMQRSLTDQPERCKAILDNSL